VQEAGVRFRHVAGRDANEEDWQFFKRCYDHTYAAHHSTPYLNLDFFLRIGATMPDNMLLIVAERDGVPIASSLVIHDGQTLYGRYWGALDMSIACISKPRITSHWNSVSPTALPASKAGHKANTRWRAASCRKKPGQHTGWRILRFPMQSRNSCNGKAAASIPILMN
jgi:hypothetical protein